MNVSMSLCRSRCAQALACALAILLAVPVSAAASAPLPSAPQPALSAQAASPSQQTTPVNGQNSPSQPVGTAAAPYIRPAGVPASQPAGAAIAPAKQRRIRVIAIRLGIILGIGIALGTVAAATLGSPSHPN